MGLRDNEYDGYLKDLAGLDYQPKDAKFEGFATHAFIVTAEIITTVPLGFAPC